MVARLEVGVVGFGSLVPLELRGAAGRKGRAPSLDREDVTRLDVDVALDGFHYRAGVPDQAGAPEFLARNGRTGPEEVATGQERRRIRLANLARWRQQPIFSCIAGLHSRGCGGY